MQVPEFFLEFWTLQLNKGMYICSLNAVAVLALDWQFGMSEPRSCKVPFRQLAGMSLLERPSAKSLRETSKFQQIPWTLDSFLCDKWSYGNSVHSGGAVNPGIGFGHRSLPLVAPAEASSNSNSHGFLWQSMAEGSAQGSFFLHQPLGGHTCWLAYHGTEDTVASWVRRTVRIACGFRWFREDYHRLLNTVRGYSWAEEPIRNTAT